jgi:hypothetical protein
MTIMLITFFDNKGVVHFEFIPQRHNQSPKLITIMCKYSRGYVKQCVEKDPSFTTTGFSTVTMLPLTRHFLAPKSITEMEHPPTSPDLAPNDLWLFTEIKSALKGGRFQDNEGIRK